MDNRIERIVAILFCCLTLAFCITACGRAEPTSDTANPMPTPEAQDTSIFQNIVNLETRLPGVLYPVINIHSNKDELCTPASMTTIMIAEADKAYATMPLGKSIFTYSGTAYEPDSETYDDDINNE